MDKIKGTGIEQIDKYEHEKRQYRKALDIWQERAEHERKIYQSEHCHRDDSKQWRGLLHIITELMMEAYAAGIEADEEPDIISKFENVSEEYVDYPMGSDFWEIIAGIIRDSYIDGQEARR